MKIQFKRYTREKILMSDIFNCDYNPYRVGDIININGIIYNKCVNENEDGIDLIKIRDPEWDAIYEVVSITHNITMKQIITQNYIHDCTIIGIRKI